MTGWRQWWRFNGVGALGIALQLIILTSLVRGGLPYSISTPIAVGLVLVHNFAWHRRWTWPTRYASTGALAAGFVRFAAANGLVSLIGNTALMPLLVSILGWPIVPANVAAIAICGVVNYWLAARVAFRVSRPLRDPSPLA